VTPRRALAACFLLLVLAGGAPGASQSTSQSATAVASRAAALPARLTDAEFWSLVETMSEPDGYFRSDNLVSNEDTFQYVIPDLQRVVKPGGVYVGVGPDQNFTFIANLKPGVVFIPDIRRGNLHMHLMYKVLMEESADRADFLARLFSRKRPAGLTATTPVDKLFGAFEDVPASKTLFDETRQLIRASLKKRHGFGLTEIDDAGIDFILGNFFTAGPFLQYSSAPVGRTRYPSFAELQMATDGAGLARAYLATEENYRAVRDLERKNLIVPLVADFGGPKTFRAIGAWVRERKANVTTLYTSNVEQYLFQDQKWNDFAGNVAALPLDETSTLIRSCFNMCLSPVPGSRVLMLLDSMPAMLRDHQAGMIGSYYDVLTRRR
jgi:hypothetical protein